MNSLIQVEETDGGIDDYWVRLKAVPILEAAADIGSGLSAGGSCSQISVNTGYFGSWSTTMHCDLFSQISGMLSAIMIGLWSLMAVRVVLSA